MKGGAKVIVEPHRHEGIFIAKQKEDVLVTRNMVVGESVYGEKRISVEQVIRRSNIVFGTLSGQLLPSFVIVCRT